MALKQSVRLPQRLSQIFRAKPSRVFLKLTQFDTEAGYTTAIASGPARLQPNGIFYAGIISLYDSCALCHVKTVSDYFFPFADPLQTA